MTLTDDQQLNARIVIRHGLASRGCLPLDKAQLDAVVAMFGAMTVPVGEAGQTPPKDHRCSCPSVACELHGLPAGAASGGW